MDFSWLIPGVAGVRNAMQRQAPPPLPPVIAPREMQPPFVTPAYAPVPQPMATAHSYGGTLNDQFNSALGTTPRPAAPPPTQTGPAYTGNVNQQFDQALGYTHTPTGPMAPLMARYDRQLGFGMSRR